MEEEFEEFEEEELEDDEEEEEYTLKEPEPVVPKKPLNISREAPKVEPRPERQPERQSVPVRKSNGQFIKKGEPVEEPREIVREKVKEAPKVEPQAREAQITAEDLIAAIQNHEQRLTAIESALFRLRGAI